MNLKSNRSYYAVAGISTALVIIAVLTLSSNSTPKTTAESVYKEPEIITEVNRKVIEDNDEAKQTISATIISKTPDGKHFSAVNNYDDKDIVVLDKTEETTWKNGDKVYITFAGDKVDSVEVVKRAP